MALAMQSTMPAAQDMDIMDIDIDMDLDDNGPAMDDEFDIEEGETFAPSGVQPLNDTSSVIPAIYNEDPALEPQWSKIHFRGVDDLHTNDILSFVSDHFPAGSDDVHIQWIDDTSLNVVFKTSQSALEAMLALVNIQTTAGAIQNAPFELRTAKQLASRPASMLMIRIAQAGDRKQKNARDASRYYLMHPDQDPTERMRREFANGRPSRENGDYKRRRFDDREHRRRRDQDHNADATDFAASMYDDAPATEPEAQSGARGRDLFSRVSKVRRRSASPEALSRNSDEIPISDSEDGGRPKKRRNGYRDRSERPPPYSRRDPDPFPRDNTGKELFERENSSRPSRKEGGLHSDRIELFPSPSITTGPTPRVASAIDTKANSAAAKRLKADLLSAAQTSPRSHHRRTKAIDAKNAEDLSERFARKSISIDSTKSGGVVMNSGIELFPSTSNTSNGGLSIRGSATTANQGFSIKGTSNINSGSGNGLNIKGRALEVKELFPSQYTRNGGGGGGGRGAGAGNHGKELFDEPVREKRVRRRAGDLFD